MASNSNFFILAIEDVNGNIEVACFFDYPQISSGHYTPYKSAQLKENFKVCKEKVKEICGFWRSTYVNGVSASIPASKASDAIKRIASDSWELSYQKAYIPD